MRAGRHHRRDRGGLRTAVFMAAALGAAACVAVVDERGGDVLVPEVPAEAVVIPLQTPSDPAQVPLFQFYDSLLQRLHAAHKENDLATMQQLLAEYRRDSAPEWVQARFAGYAQLCEGLRFELHAAATAQLVPSERAAASTTEAPSVDQPKPADPKPAPANPASANAAGVPVGVPATPQLGDEIGEVVEYDLVLPPLPDQPVALGGRDDADPVGIAVRVAITDEFVDGTTRNDSRTESVQLPTAFVLGVDGGKGPLRLPAVRLAFADTGSVRRTLDVRVDLLPSYVGIAGERAPVRRKTLAALRLQQWPQGYLPIQQKPLAALQAAMQLGDRAHFAHVRLAAEFAPAEDRAKVEEKLIDWVRLGRPDQARVAMATLRALGSAQIALGDRDGWLAWWHSRR